MVSYTSTMSPFTRPSFRHSGAGMTRDLGESSAPGSLGHYRSLMQAEFRDEIKQGIPVPGSLADIILGAYRQLTSPDDTRRRQIATNLRRAHSGYSGELGGFTVPSGLANDFMSEVLSVERTMTGITGSAGGFTIRPAFSTDILDKARLRIGPWALCSWEPVKTRQYYLPVSADYSPTSDITATWGYGETVLPAKTDALLGRLKLELSRLLIYTQVSRDMMADAESLGRWLNYRGRNQIRTVLEYSMVNGPTTTSGLPSPIGAISSPATAIIKRAGSNALAVKDVDSLWQGLSPACQQNAVWHASTSAIDALDELNGSGQFPVNLYFPAGSSPMGTPYATIKGQPVIPLPTCPKLGTPGDLFVCDWSQYVFAYYQYGPMDSPMAFSILPPSDQYHRGIVGMPFDSIEARKTEEFSFTSDVIDVVFKLRGMGGFIWPLTYTNTDGTVVGPCAALTT